MARVPRNAIKWVRTQRESRHSCCRCEGDRRFSKNLAASYKIKHTPTIRHRKNSTSRYFYPWEMKMYVHTKTSTHVMWSTASFITAKCWNNKCPSRGEEIACGFIPTMDYYPALKGRNPIPPDKCQKRYAKWEEATHRRALHKIPHNENSSKWELSL